jgi:hypothetical protein
MATLSIHALASNKLLLKGSALLLSFLLWSQLTRLHNHNLTVTVPVCFYGEAATTTQHDAPETITVTLQGKKRDIATLDKSMLAVHIDSTTLRPGINGIVLTSKNLFLPEAIAVVHYTPLPLVIVKLEEKAQ